MKRVKLNKQERNIEGKLDEYVPIKNSEYRAIVEAITTRRKDAVLNIRINRQDLERLKHKAEKLGIKYQSFITEILHKIAQL